MQPHANGPMFTLSVVSHGQGALVSQLLDDLERWPVDMFEVVLTLNLPEDERQLCRPRPYAMRWLRNATPKGFGANHNAAFAASRGAAFVVVNPDIRLPHDDVLPRLSAAMAQGRVGACAPLVLNSSGGVEDSARRFPTLGRLSRRVFLGQRSIDYAVGSEVIDVDWVAGMFVVFARTAFAQVGGFDDRRFFMYYEDVDICRRLRAQGWSVRLQPQTSVIHDAQRASRRSLRHLRWHVTSAARYLTGL